MASLAHSKGTADVRCGSKCEKLNVSKSSPLCPIERTSMGRAGTSLMGHGRLMQRSKRYSYSITSSARATSVAGSSRPSVLAVFRLMISSNFVA